MRAHANVGIIPTGSVLIGSPRDDGYWMTLQVLSTHWIGPYSTTPDKVVGGVPSWYQSTLVRPLSPFGIKYGTSSPYQVALPWWTDRCVL